MTTDTDNQRSAQARPERKPRRKASAMDVTAIGIGCFWFGTVEDGSNDEVGFDPEIRLKNIKEALESIDNISDVDVGRNIPYSSYSWVDGGELIPLLVKSAISFNIFMPDRLKDKYLMGLASPVEQDYFQVLILYDRGLPVTYITYDIRVQKAKLREHFPSSAVVFIRMYLAEKLADHKRVSFNIIGPSPFHADFFVTDTDKGEDAEIEDLTKLGDGYRTILCKIGTDNADALGKFVDRYGKTISSYYLSVRYRNASLDFGEKILKGMSELSNLMIPGRSSRKKLGFWRQGERIDELLNTIIRDKINRIQFSEHLYREREEGFINENDVFFRFFEREAKDTFELPLEDIKQLLSILEERRQRSRSNRAVLLSGVLGGVLGAFLVAISTFFLSTNVVLTSEPQMTPANGAPSSTASPDRH